VFISDQTLSKEPVFYFAEEGELHGDALTGTIVLLLKNGSIHRSPGSKDVYQYARFDRYRVRVNLGELLIPRAGTTRRRQMEEMTLPELRQEIRGESHDEKQAAKLRLNYHQRIALPFGALVFCTLAVPLALLAQRAVRYTGFSLSIVVMLLYFVLMQAGSGLAFAGILPASLGAWLPNLVMGAMGVYLTWRKAEEKPVRLLEAYAQAVQDLQEALRRRFQARE
jgi:lipopolysaccharide export LptBFGC system permease protein LptF